MRPPTLLAALTLSLALTVPASASTPVLSPERQFADGLQLASDVRELLATPSATAAVLASARAAGVELDQVAPPAPASVGEAISSISAAVEKANGIVRASTESEGMSHSRAIRLVLRAASDPASYRGPREGDPSNALNAAAVLAAAIDAAMPALAASSAPGEAATGCDVLDQRPNLCVGGSGANSYSDQSAVFIDLGGDDTYSAPFLATGALGVGIVVDAAGNDVYAPANGGGIGSASVGGVGMVVDGGGDDVYREESTTVSVGGMGLGVLGGAGFLVDAAGNDKYQMTNHVEGAPAGAAGMGEGFFGGAAALVDGQGNDTYDVDVLSLPKTVQVEGKTSNLYATAAATAQGAGGFGGVGILSDSGGTDTFKNNPRMGAADPSLPVKYQGDPVAVPSAVAGGQGNTILAGVGLLFEGSGPTRYEMTASLGPAPLDDQNATSRVWGQGMGTGLVSGADSNAQGILSDAGGDDTYVLSSSVTTSTESSFTACPCPSAIAQAGSPTTMGQGYGMYGGQGILADVGGNDSYSSEALSSSTAIVHDGRTAGGAKKAASSSAAAPILVAQGAGGTQAGQGLLRDTAGDDRYVAKATSEATADGDSVVPANSPILGPSAVAPDATAQGAGRLLGGSGYIVDLAGADRYEAIASATALEAGVAASLPAAIYAQGSVNPSGATGAGGASIDLGGVDADVYVTSPPLAACNGTRGQAVWQDCSQEAYGVNA